MRRAPNVVIRVVGVRQILQLYVAAYQPPTVWRDVWRYLVGVISVQIIKDVEAFVGRREFAHEDVMRFLVRS